MELRTIVVLSFLFCGTSAFEITNTTEGNITVTCETVHEYDAIDIQQLMGKWTAVEVYMHLNKEGVLRYHTCPSVKLWEHDELPTTTFGVGSFTALAVLNKKKQLQGIKSTKKQQL